MKIRGVQAQQLYMRQPGLVVKERGGKWATYGRQIVRQFVIVISKLAYGKQK